MHIEFLLNIFNFFLFLQFKYFQSVLQLYGVLEALFPLVLEFTLNLET